MHTLFQNTARESDCIIRVEINSPMWNSPGVLKELTDKIWILLGKHIGVGSHSLFQGIFLTQGLNLCLLHCSMILYHLSHQGGPGNHRELVPEEKRVCCDCQKVKRSRFEKFWTFVVECQQNCRADFSCEELKSN